MYVYIVDIVPLTGGVVLFKILEKKKHILFLQ